MAGIEPIIPDWPAPANVKAYCTTRSGGVSGGPWRSLNLAAHVQDDPQAVAENRRRLADELGLPTPPRWLTQVHGATIALSDNATGDEADGRYSDRRGQVCAVLTADCLPVLLCDRSGREVAAVHAGWRGLANGVLEAAVRRFRREPANLLAWLGPAIGPQAFEVGEEVRMAFVRDHADAEGAFAANRPGHWLANLYELARIRLAACGVSATFGGDFCTFTEDNRFYSYRRDVITGRMASLIWFDTVEGQ